MDMPVKPTPAQPPEKKEVVGWRRILLVLLQTDPEPVELGNIFFLLIVVFTYLPDPRSLLYDPFHFDALGIVATVSVIVALTAFYAIFWQPAGLLRRVTLGAKACIWIVLGVSVGLRVGLANVRTAFCIVLTFSSLWAAYRVGKRPL